MRASGIALLFCMVAVSCKSLGLSAFAPPVVTLRDVKLAGMNLSGGTLNVAIGIRNPNGYRLDASRLTYRLLVDSTELGSGGLDTTMTVQAGDSTMLNLPLGFTFAGLGVVARRLLGTGSLEYRVVGELTVATPLGKRVQAYDQKGRYDVFMPQQQIPFGGPEISRDR